MQALGGTMPFPKQTPREFTRVNVERISLNQMGVYGLFRKNGWVYIGKGNIRDRLLKHLNGDNPRITEEHPTHFVSEVTQYMDVREPVANRRVG
jgi:hypothetical protein